MYTPREPLRLSGLIRGLQGVQICGGCHDSLNLAEQGILTGPWMPEARLRKMLFLPVVRQAPGDLNADV
jgi:hypothetical protein